VAASSLEAARCSLSAAGAAGALYRGRCRAVGALGDRGRWAPPDATGKAFAWLSFLSESAPYAELPLGSSFELRMGRAALGQATLRVFPKTATAFKENDFIGDPAAPMRSAA